MNIHKLLVKAVGGTGDGPVDLPNVLMKYRASYYHIISVSNSKIVLKPLGSHTLWDMKTILGDEFAKWHERLNTISLDYDTRFTPVSAKASKGLGRTPMTVITCE